MQTLREKMLRLCLGRREASNRPSKIHFTRQRKTNDWIRWQLSSVLSKITEESFHAQSTFRVLLTYIHFSVQLSVVGPRVHTGRFNTERRGITSTYYSSVFNFSINSLCTLGTRLCSFLNFNAIRINQKMLWHLCPRMNVVLVQKSSATDYMHN